MRRRQRPDKHVQSLAGRAAAAFGLLLAVVCGATAAQAVPRTYSLPRSGEARPLIRPTARSSLTLQQAVAIAMQRYNGRVVRAETKTMNGRRVYEIRMIDSAGRVRTIFIDAKTGRFL